MSDFLWLAVNRLVVNQTTSFLNSAVERKHLTPSFISGIKKNFLGSNSFVLKASETNWNVTFFFAETIYFNIMFAGPRGSAEKNLSIGSELYAKLVLLLESSRELIRGYQNNHRDCVDNNFNVFSDSKKNFHISFRDYSGARLMKSAPLF